MTVKIAVHGDDLRRLATIQHRRRRDWPAVFSTNPAGEIWPFDTYGFTRPERRNCVDGHDALLDAIAKFVLDVRPTGGRFFIDARGAFVHPADQSPTQIVEFTDRRTPGFLIVARKVDRDLRSRFEDPRRAHADGRCDRERCSFCAEDRVKHLARERDRLATQVADRMLGVEPRRKKRWER